MNLKLYELVEELMFLERIEPASDEEEQRVRDTLESVNLAIHDKGTNIGKHLLSLQAQEAACKMEEDRLRARRQAIHNRYEWLKKYLFGELRLAGITQIKTDICTISISKSPPSVEVTDVNELPAEYQRMTIEADKKKILDYFKETGIILGGVNIHTDREHLTIR